MFMVQQGNILGNIISKNGISTDFEKIKIIVELPRPRNAKQVQGFMGTMDTTEGLSTYTNDIKTLVWLDYSVHLNRRVRWIF